MSRRSLVTILAAAALLAVAAVAVVALRPGGTGDAEERPAAARYHCPMHPTVVSDGPGSCPICGMDLVPIGEQETEPTRFHCPMHPTVVSDEPGSCPICGMDLVPIPKQEVGAGETGSVGEEASGLATIRISSQKRQLIGVRTAPVSRTSFERTIRAVGRVAVDETRIRRVTAKIGGYVERLNANAVGQAVRKGEPMLEIYSPELLASQNEYLIALAARERTAGSSISAVAGYGADLVASARRRLQLFDLTDAQIDRLERTGQAQRVVTLHAPISGVILAREIAQGQRIEAGTTLLEVADLSRVWALASVYEYELPFVRDGQPATVSLSYLPGRTFEGKVSFLYPTVDPQTRTALVRVEIPNPDLELKPDMYAEVVLRADLGVRVAVPRSAVLETGTRSVTFVETAPGEFQPREIEIGLRLEDEYEVLGGLSAGESVVISGNFLIDSESRLKSALKGSAPGHAH